MFTGNPFTGRTNEREVFEALEKPEFLALFFPRTLINFSLFLFLIGTFVTIQNYTVIV